MFKSSNIFHFPEYFMLLSFIVELKIICQAGYAEHISRDTKPSEMKI